MSNGFCHQWHRCESVGLKKAHNRPAECDIDLKLTRAFKPRRIFWEIKWGFDWKVDSFFMRNPKIVSEVSLRAVRL